MLITVLGKSELGRAFRNFSCFYSPIIRKILILRNCVNFLSSPFWQIDIKYHSVIASNAARIVRTGTISILTFSSFDKDL